MRQPGGVSESELVIDSRSPNASSSSDHKAAFLPALHLGGSLAQVLLSIACRWQSQGGKPCDHSCLGCLLGQFSLGKHLGSCPLSPPGLLTLEKHFLASQRSGAQQGCFSQEPRIGHRWSQAVARGQRQSAGTFTPCCQLSALIQSRQLSVPDMFAGRAGGSSAN